MPEQLLSGLVGAGAVLLISIIERSITYGRLSQKVDNLSNIVTNGLTSKVSQTCTDVAELRGTFDTYLKLESDNKTLLINRVEALEKSLFREKS